MRNAKASRWKSVALLALALAALLLGAAACGPVPVEPIAASAPEVTDGVFRLGVLGPFTGPSESTGREYQGAVTMAFEAIDSHIGDYEIELVWIDSQSDPEAAVMAYEKAVLEDGIQAAILNWHSSVAVEAMEVAANYQIPHIFPYGATEAVNAKFHSDPERYGYWMNKGWPEPAKLTVSYVEAVEDAIERGLWQPQDKTVAICGENTHWGRSFGAAIRTQLEEAGWTTLSEDYFSLDEVQFHPLLNRLKAEEVTLIAVTTTSMPSFAAFINQADEVGLDSLLIADGLGWAGDWYAVTGDSSNYVIDQIPGWATEKGQAFADAFEQRWGVPPSPSAAGLAYDGAGMFIQVAQHALAKYGTLSSDTVYDWAANNLQMGAWAYTDGIVMEAYRYTPETLPDPVVGAGYYMFPVRQYFDGVGRIVYPAEWAEQPLQAKPLR